MIATPEGVRYRVTVSSGTAHAHCCGETAFWLSDSGRWENGGVLRHLQASLATFTTCRHRETTVEFGSYSRPNAGLGSSGQRWRN